MVEIRFIDDGEVDEFRQAFAAGFGFDAIDDDGEAERFRAVFPIETCLAAFDGSQIVGTFGSFDLELTVPGGMVPMAGPTVVTVHPAYRRRGVLSQMMGMHLDQARERGQPLAGLWASEAKIYGRFGYGVAAEGQELRIDAVSVQLPATPHVIVRPLPADEFGKVLPEVYDRILPEVPGHFARSRSWWDSRTLHDPERFRDGASAKRVVVAVIDDEVTGYVMYRQKQKWEGFVPSGTVDVIELVTADDVARLALWGFLLNVDLFPSVEYWNAPLDDPLLDVVDNPRGIMRKPFDTLWLRLLDVPRMLQARAYEHDGVLVVAVTDGEVRSVLRLEVEDGAAECRTTRGDADVELSVGVLGSIYLGGIRARRHARAGRITGTPEKVRLLDRLFRAEVLPHALEVF